MRIVRAAIVAAALGAAYCVAGVANADTAGRATEPTVADFPWRTRIAATRTFLDSREGRVGFAVIDELGRLRGGRRVHEGFRSASVVKVIMMTCYLNHPTVRNRVLTDADRQLLAPMIRSSANGPAHTIYATKGAPCLLRAARRLGLRGFTTESKWGRSRVSPAGVARMFWRIDSVIVPRHRKYAMRLLRSVVTSQHWGLPAATPRGFGIRFKGGWAAAQHGGRIVNQGARFVRGDRRLTLAVLTEGSPTHIYGARTIRGVGERLLRNYARFRRVSS